MNRYLFKAKRKDGEWVYGNLLEPTKMNVFSNINHNDKFCLIVESSFANGGRVCVGKKHWVLRETLCQCTGLQDRDGKDIFENDIVEDIDTGDVCYLVVFDEAKFKLNKNSVNYDIDGVSDFKIIGNKFDKEED